jgi:hypothetical protein
MKVRFVPADNGFCLKDLYRTRIFLPQLVEKKSPHLMDVMDDT